LSNVIEIVNQKFHIQLQVIVTQLPSL